MTITEFLATVDRPQPADDRARTRHAPAREAAPTAYHWGRHHMTIDRALLVAVGLRGAP